MKILSEHAVETLHDMLETQSQDGIWNYDDRMLGMFNGMEVMMAIVEHRDVKFRDCKTEDFLINKTKKEVSMDDKTVKEMYQTALKCMREYNEKQESKVAYDEKLGINKLFGRDPEKNEALALEMFKDAGKEMAEEFKKGYDLDRELTIDGDQEYNKKHNLPNIY